MTGCYSEERLQLSRNWPWTSIPRTTVQQSLATNPGTPSTAGSDQFFAGFFADHGVSLATALQKDGFTAEIDKFKTFISQNNFENIKRIKSSTAFWEQNSGAIPHIARLFLLLNTIPSTSASIERYFSICGFVSNKRSSNMAPDLFVTRCLLRANLGLLTELTVSSENNSNEITASNNFQFVERTPCMSETFDRSKN